MKGDFSRWHYDRGDNFLGILPQQGRVLLDSDGLAQTSILNDWQDVAATDTIGSGVAAYPAALPMSFKIVSARVDTGEVKVTIGPGRVWADGLLVHSPATVNVERVATYLEPPIQSPQALAASIAANVRDAVVLEVSRQAINGFQLPEVLIEPALGGPDTAERVHTSAALRLYRMGPGDTCANIPIADNFAAKGKLDVSLQPTVTVPGDCPVVQSGGYAGFEHHLYRIEIADLPPASAPMFKWSRFNGGLVGRGIFAGGPTPRVNITANLAAINTCGLSKFYLEAEKFNAARGVWEVVYGAEATLNNSNQLVLNPAATFGVIPASPTPPADPETVFFRLWDGLKPISAFAASTDLEDGIMLRFDAASGSNYSARDYWMFQVRAGGVPNPQVLIANQPPQGIVHRRVALGVITWTAGLTATAPVDISDCRDPFQPLTRTAGCCTYRVGDGIHSHGDFTSIQAAVDALPADGGEVCILAGVYRENVRIWKRRNIRMHGCGPRSRIVVDSLPAAPGIHVRDSRGIHIDALAVEAHAAAPAILLDNIEFDDAPGFPGNRAPQLRDIHLTGLRLIAIERSAIEFRGGQFAEIRRCDIRMTEVPSSWPGIFFLGDDGLIEENNVVVRRRRQSVSGQDDIIFPGPAGSALGGIQIGGTSDRVRIIDNLIQGGIGNGITLGSMIQVDANGRDRGPIGWVVNSDDPCNPCKPGDILFRPGRQGRDDRTTSAGPLTEIRIERNRIYDMGLNGIGVVAFFDLRNSAEMIVAQRLEILGNDIRRCLLRRIEEIPTPMRDRMGYGGIALAAVEDLTIYDNRIEDNGRNRVDPICGIFILLAQGFDISRNQILNNGSRSEEPVTSAKPGQRGGIVIMLATHPPAAAVAVKLEAFALPAQLERPALRVHDNVVVAPLGRALSVTALGNISVADNQLASQGATFREGSLDGLFVTTVYIANLGRNFEAPGQLSGFQGIAVADARPTVSAAAVQPRLFANGRVLFSDNQVTLNVTERGPTFAATSITIFTLDDVGFTDNQSQMLLTDDVVLANTLLFGISVRANSNRWEEPLPNALYSAVTLGLMNVTAHNVATHCIVAAALPKLLVKEPNVILLGQFLDDPCGRVSQILPGFGKARG